MPGTRSLPLRSSTSVCSVYSSYASWLKHSGMLLGGGVGPQVIGHSEWLCRSQSGCTKERLPLLGSLGLGGKPETCGVAHAKRLLAGARPTLLSSQRRLVDQQEIESLTAMTSWHIPSALHTVESAEEQVYLFHISSCLKQSKSAVSHGGW